jgi:hypothetical protein
MFEVKKSKKRAAPLFPVEAMIAGKAAGASPPGA